MAIREGRWDCPSCGSTAIPGRHTDCTGCGKPRPRGVRFYLPTDAPAVTDAAQLRHATAGADWICQHCEASNRATLTRCDGCGAFRGSRNPLQKVRQYTAGETPRTGDAPPATAGPLPLAGVGGSNPPPRRPGVTGTRGPEKPIGHRIGYVVAGVMALVVLVGMIRESVPERTPVLVPAVVEAVVWERRVVMMQHGIVAGEGWELPDSATDVVRTERIREYRQELAGYETVSRQVPRTRRVLQGYRDETRTWEEREQTGTRTYNCGSRDLGNGYFEDVECTEPEYTSVTHSEEVSVPVYETETYYETETEQKPIYRQVPVMAPYYTYRAPRWTPADTLRMAGTWMTPPEWPRTDTAATRREGHRHERYEVVLRDGEGGRRPVSVAAQAITQYRSGQRVAYGPVGGRRSYASIEPVDALPACQRWQRGRGKAPPSSLGCSPRAARR